MPSKTSLTRQRPAKQRKPATKKRTDKDIFVDLFMLTGNLQTLHYDVALVRLAMEGVIRWTEGDPHAETRKNEVSPGEVRAYSEPVLGQLDTMSQQTWDYFHQLVELIHELRAALKKPVQKRAA